MPSIELAAQVALKPGRSSHFKEQRDSSPCSKPVRLLNTEILLDKKTDVRLLGAPPPTSPRQSSQSHHPAKVTTQPDITFVQTDTGMNLNRNYQSPQQQEHPLRSPPEHITSVEPIYQNSNYRPPAQAAPVVIQPDPESLTLSDSDFGEFVSGMVPIEQPRIRSNSFTFRRNTPQNQSYHNSSLAHMMPRLDESKLGRAGSADNLVFNQNNQSQAAVHPSLRLTHSHTLSEIPQRHALSNDSGYDTPPVQPRPRTSEAWPLHQHPQWNRTSSQSQASNQTVHQNLPMAPTGHLNLQLPSMSRAQVPTNQGLTIDVQGHFQEESETGPLTLSIVDPISRSHYGYTSLGGASSNANQNFRGVDPRYTFSAQRSMTTSQEESKLLYIQHQLHSYAPVVADLLSVSVPMYHNHTV